MLAAVLSGYALSPVAPWLQRFGRGATGWIIALLPLSLFAYFARLIGPIAAGETIAVTYPWVPSLGVNLSFYLDGLSLLFTLLITGIGALVIIYASGYLAHDQAIGRFYAWTLVFMASMLGGVLADNLITLFVFWELTTISSYMLIGFNHTKDRSRAAALQALLVTSTGGLAMLAGLILLGQIGGSLELSVLVERADAIRADALYLPVLILILLGAFAKSAQVPFHFWLPNAMEAPTPVSAYLHSATMVKAGIYLMARLSPTLGGTAAWQYTVTGVGATTMLLGALMAWYQSDLKRILAYSTISALGILTMLLGLGSELAAEAMVVFLLGHALYKGALFLVVGIIDHETGTREIEKLGGLRRAMPITAAAALIAALSMASIPPFLGFIGKELLYEATLEAHLLEIVLISVAVFANILYVAAAAIAGIRPFWGKAGHPPKHPHEAPVNMWLGPVLLAAGGLLLGLFPAGATLLAAPATSAITHHESHVHLALWHGFSLVLLLSAVTIAGGFGVYVGRDRLRPLVAPLAGLGRWGPERGYNLGLKGLIWLAAAQTRIIQHGYLRYYMMTIIITGIVLVGLPMLNAAELTWSLALVDLRFYELTVAGLILISAYAAVRAKSRLGAIAALGVIGYGIAMIFVWFSAPDLAMTQFAVETLTVLLFVLVLYRLPRYRDLTRPAGRVRDAIVALTAGGLVTGLVLVATQVQFQEPISSYMAENSVPIAHGHNIVNVILVDFRGLDTMGEITVLSLAGIGVYSLLRLYMDKGKDQPK